MQSALAEIYDLAATPDVAQFLMTDRASVERFEGTRDSEEQLLVAQEEDGIALALYIDAAVLERLARRDPFAALTADNLGDYLTVAEGVSHFVYVAWNAGFDKPVTLLELELQAEVDKYVLGAWLLREQGSGRFPRELHRALFERARIDPDGGGGPRAAVPRGPRVMRKGFAGASRPAWRAARAAPRGICWRSYAASIDGAMRARCGTSNATPDCGEAPRNHSTSTSTSSPAPCGPPAHVSA
jgi:hypothetical protein